MRNTITLLVLLGTVQGLSATAARAQCHAVFAPTFYAHHSSHCHCHSRDSCAVDKPLVPGRWGGYMGMLGLADRRGHLYAGGDMAGYYWLGPRWASGLRGNITGKMPVGSASETYMGAQQPLVDQYGITWTNNLLLLDQARWRVMALAGAGVGGVRLYDKAVQVPTKGGCGCTSAQQVASATAPVTEVGLAALYKLKGADAPWLTLRGEYRTWNGSAPFGLPQQFSSYLVSVGVSLPDAPPKRK
ncbi:hypothetical protein [Hymenobacter daeguensis]